MAELDNTLQRLPHTYRKDPQGVIGKVLSIFTGQIEELQTAAAQVMNSRDIDQAKGQSGSRNKTLDYIGSNVQQPRGQTDDLLYAALIKTKIARNLNKGDMNSLIQLLSMTLGCSYSEIEITERWELANPEPAALSISIPSHLLNDIRMTPKQFNSLVERIISAGVRVDSLYEGTFAFASQQDQPEYNSPYGIDNGELSLFYSVEGGGDELPL